MFSYLDNETVTGLLVCALFFNPLHAEEGCLAVVESPVEEGCSAFNPLGDIKSSFNEGMVSESLNTVSENSLEYKTNITVGVSSFNVFYNKHELLIERKLVNHKSCPPFCIQPLAIEGVQTVGELETLQFIEQLKENRPMLLLDVRENNFFKLSTLPGSINLPYTMLKKSSPYFKEIILLLGAKKTTSKKYFFKNPYKLLIFSDGILDDRAVLFIKKLIKLGYPKNKLLYYRGGIESWKSVGLTLF